MAAQETHDLKLITAGLSDHEGHQQPQKWKHGPVSAFIKTVLQRLGRFVVIRLVQIAEAQPACRHPVRNDEYFHISFRCVV